MRGLNRLLAKLPKLSHEQLGGILRDVAAENALLSSIFDSLSTGLIIVDRKWKILQTNKAADRFLFDGAAGESKFESDFVWQSVSEKEIGGFLKKTAASGKSNVSEEFTTAGVDGTTRFLTVSIFSYVNRSVLAGNIIKIEDITQKRAKEVLSRRMEHMSGLTNLAAGMAHEIKNPLGAIGIHIQLAQRVIKKHRESDGVLPEKKHLEDRLDIVNQEIERLNTLVMDFLFAVRPVKASLMLKDPAAILKNIADFFSPEFGRAHVVVSLKTPEKPCRLLIDEKLFREVIINIAQNAFAAIKERYTECSETCSCSGACPGKIDFIAEVKNDSYVISIADNGSGIDERDIPRIFEPYYTTKASGTGLGMTMAYKIIKEFNGDIQVKSAKGEGTKISILIPIPQTDKKLLASGAEAD
ncbi:MAG: two-component system sensor histidine kinase NtrB [Treponema sp.]